MKRTLGTVFLCLLLVTPAWAGFDDGVAAYKRGDYATALRDERERCAKVAEIHAGTEPAGYWAEGTKIAAAIRGTADG